MSDKGPSGTVLGGTARTQVAEAVDPTGTDAGAIAATLPATGVPRSEGAIAATLPATDTDVAFALPVVAASAYSLGDELARGGMGRILRAADRRLRRPVAIKELLDPGGMLRGRFEREALITARLQHPAIVPIYEAGQWPSGEPFYTMKLVSGRPLDRVIAETTSLGERIALLPKVIAISEAIAYAHKHRVIHRDIKPHNVIVGELGETVVIDWGLAKDLDDDATGDTTLPTIATSSAVETVVGNVMGTPAYMPPEQARGDAVDERADVYSLGALLYHVLANRNPYEGAHPRGILAAVIHGPPRSLVEIDPEIPPDLAAIVDKAMARDPAARYPHAGKLVEDLVRFQSGQLVGVHRYSFGELVRRWARRHRTALVLGTLSLVVLATIGIIAIRGVVKANEIAEANEAEAKRQSAVALEQKRVSDETATALLVEQGRMLMLSGDVERATAFLLEAYTRGDRSVALRQLLATAMRDSETAKQTLGPFAAASSLVGFMPDGKLVHVEDGGRVHVDTRTFSVPGGKEYVLDPSSRELAVWRTGEAATMVLELWDVERGMLRWSVRMPHDHSEAPVLEMDRTGKRFVVISTVADLDHAELRDAATGNVIAALDIGGSSIAGAFSADGKRVAACNDKGAVRVWDAATRAVLLSGTGAAGCDLVMFSGSDRIVAVDSSSSKSQQITVWTIGKPTPVALAATGFDPLVAASEAHNLIAVVHGYSGERTLALWSPTGERLRGGGTIKDALGKLRFSNDGRLLVASGDSDRLYIWDIPTLHLRHGLDAHREWVGDFAIDDTGHRIATTGAGDRSVRLWALTDHVFQGMTSTSVVAGEQWFVLHGDKLEVRRQDTAAKIRDIDFGAIAIKSDGDPVLLASRDGRRLLSVVRTVDKLLIRVVDPGGGAPVDIPFPYVAGTSFVTDLSGDGRFIATSSPTDTRVFDASSGRLVRQWNRDAPTTKDLFVEVSFDGTHVVTGVGGAIQLLRVSAGDAVPMPSLSNVTYARFDGTGKTLFALNEDAHQTVVATRIDVATGKALRVFTGGNNLAGLGTSDDGRRLATLSASEVVEVWNVDTGVELASVARVSAASLTNDGERFATGDKAGEITVWETATRRELARFQTFGWVKSLQFSPDGTHLLTEGVGGVTALLDVHLETRPAAELTAIAGRYSRWKLDGGVLVSK